MMKYPYRQAFSWLLVGVFHHFFLASAQAQDADFSTGKSLHQLLDAIQSPSPQDFKFNFPPAPSIQYPASRIQPPASSIFLPRWSSEDLPFFCKIEHDWAKGRNRVPIKFRLGSVDYVDWLEGKSWDKTRY